MIDPVQIFIDRLKKVTNLKIKDFQNQVISGASITDYAGYRYVVGQIEGMTKLESLFNGAFESIKSDIAEEENDYQKFRR